MTSQVTRTISLDGTQRSTAYVASTSCTWHRLRPGRTYGLQHPGARRRHEAEALSTAKALKTAGWNFSVGLGQINVVNFSRLGLTLESAFQPCTNLAAMQTILAECFHRARAGSARATTDQAALQRALSCYYSGTFTTGFRHGYVRKVGTTLKSFRSAPTRQELFTSRRLAVALIACVLIGRHRKGLLLHETSTSQA